MSSKTLGSKIHEYRIREGLSQFDLELKIDVSPGVISRIENGQTNPNKETLLKIIEALNLKSYEAASLFNLNIAKTPSLIEAIKKVNTSLNIDEILQTSVNEIAKELNLLGASIFLLKDNTLYAKTYTDSWYTSLLFKTLTEPFYKLKVDLSTKENFLVKSILEKKPIFSSNAEDFGLPLLSPRILKLVVKLTGFKCALACPIIYNDKVLGVILFSRNYLNDFSEDIPIIQAYTDFVATSIINAEKYSELKKKA